MRLSVSLGLAITSAVYSSSLSTPQARKNITCAFDRAFLCTILFAAVGILCIPFMKIGKQGGKNDTSSTEMIETNVFGTNVFDEERPRTASEYRDDEEHLRDEEHTLWSENEKNLTTFASYGSHKQTYFPRWSWEDDREMRENRYRELERDGIVVYEVCIKCLAEQRRVVSSYGGSQSQSALESAGVQCSYGESEPT